MQIHSRDAFHSDLEVFPHRTGIEAGKIRVDFLAETDFVMRPKSVLEGRDDHPIIISALVTHSLQRKATTFAGKSVSRTIIGASTSVRRTVSYRFFMPSDS